MSTTNLQTRRFRGLIEGGSAGLVVTDADFKVIDASPSLARILEYSAEELMDRPATEFLHAEDEARLREAFEALAQTPKAVWTGTFRVVTKSGSTRWIEAEAINLLDDPDVRAIVSSYRDVSESHEIRVRTEQQLDRMLRAIEQTADSVFVTNVDGVIEYVNPAFETMSGYSRDEAIGNTPRLLRSGLQSQRFYQSLWETILAGKVFRGVLANRRKDGTVYDEDQTITPIQDASGTITHFLSTGRDITQRTRAQSALRRLNHQLEKEAARIAGALHDEAGQFLTSAHLQLADVACGASPELRDRLQVVRQTLDQVEEQLRRLSHEIHPRAVEDLGLFEAVRFLAEAFAKRTGIEIDVAVTACQDERLPLAIETLLYRMVQEGLTNLHRHAGADRASITITHENGEIRCSIRDNGKGFNPEAITTGNGGLGLRLMDDRLAAEGGTLAIVSAPGEGTELRAVIPLES